MTLWYQGATTAAVGRQWHEQLELMEHTGKVAMSAAAVTMYNLANVFQMIPALLVARLLAVNCRELDVLAQPPETLTVALLFQNGTHEQFGGASALQAAQRNLTLQTANSRPRSLVLFRKYQTAAEQSDYERERCCRKSEERSTTSRCATDHATQTLQHK